ncbi:ATP-binding protein [Corynebacterium glyciniphilum]|uniref:RNA-binding domain-containing protein n=1 Tax=Corynebacterium glyciniphilum TaxID=1404244 RepID=UPI002652139C|nr:ATP-binding protein [Corynebacterium glyciniphilum]MDN5683774.1 putative DNA binding domain-containing protein [Corynebacterium glyciniphilum]MDN6706789.1 putative DNA binding domain-containing protein [Corynebacterium glyciniphilum]
MTPPAWTCDTVISTPEDQWFDRKSFRIQGKDLAKTIIAFANSDGGTVALGIHSGQLEGLPSPDQLNQFRQIGVEQVNPTVRYDLSILDCQDKDGNPAQVCLIDVPASEQVHESTDGTCYLRIGDQSMKLNFDDQLELRYSKGERQFDSQPTRGAEGLGLAPLNTEKVETYADTIGARDAVSALRGRHLLTRRGEVTVAAELLFGTDPQEFFPNALIRVLQYESPRRETGRRQNIVEDIRIEGTLPSMIEEAAATVRRLLPRHRRLNDTGTFTWQATLPEDAWLEGLVNAVLHRSYSLAGDHIRVELYPDRIEITSPGRFPGLADPRTPLAIARFARNPLIARVAIDLGVGQELGEGIRRIYDEMRAGGFTDPEYRQTSGTVTLILRAEHAVDARTMDRLPRYADDILAALREARTPLGTGEIVDIMAVNRPAVQRALKALRKEGLVTWSGQSPRDPRAVWSLPDTTLTQR